MFGDPRGANLGRGESVERAVGRRVFYSMGHGLDDDLGFEQRLPPFGRTIRAAVV